MDSGVIHCNVYGYLSQSLRHYYFIDNNNNIDFISDIIINIQLWLWYKRALKQNTEWHTFTTGKYY